MERKERIEKLRKYLKKNDFSAIIIPSTDPHFGEYIPDHYKVIEWLSGFTGEAATLVITLKKAAIWVDSRFFIQGARQLEGSGVEMMKLKMEGTPRISEWLKEQLSEEDMVAMDEDLFSYADYVGMVEALSPLSPALVEDPFDEIWPDRPALVFNPIRYVGDEISGESVSSKHKRLVERLKEKVEYSFAYIISTLDDIAWLCNIRGTDVEYNPLALAYAVVTENDINLFLRQEMLSEDAIRQLTSQGVILNDYENFEKYLRHLSLEYVRIFASGRVTAKYYLAALEEVMNSPISPLLPDPSVGGTITVMKAVKNQVEIDGFRKAYKEDAKALRKFFNWVHENKSAGITEYDAVLKLIEFRSECPDYLGESFQPIVAYMENAAFPHYAPSESNCTEIKPSGMLLVDTGAQYTYGTTDTTRMIILGELSQEQKDDYTAVLKGMIDLSMAKFPKGTRGCQLDMLARQPIMSRGRMYYHGTSHGIGHNLCVHEGPQSIRMEENPVVLEPGMIMSNEPAIYLEGRYGIRHENTILVTPWQNNEFGEFYQFETMTYIPFETEAVNLDMLDDGEKKWLDEFNSRINLV